MHGGLIFMAKAGKGYLNAGLGHIVDIILAIIPFTSWLLGGITRLMRGHIISGILQLITPLAVVFWILDIITVVTKEDLTYWA